MLAIIPIKIIGMVSAVLKKEKLKKIKAEFKG